MPLQKNYQPSAVEAKHYARWEEDASFACGLTKSNVPPADSDPYTIVIPPPNVTGSLHMGHALNNTLQDILIRYSRMSGRDALWQPGMDHAGIATQMVVERQLAEKNIELDRGRGEAAENKELINRSDFIDKVWEWKAESGGTIVQQLRRLGASCDWSRERFTMDDGLSKAVRHVFVTLYNEGLIYRDKRLVNWDPKFHTAISDLEVEQRETNGSLWYFKYPIEGVENQFITVATTRPETMLGDTAVAVHPDDERYKDLVGRNVILPLADRPIPIIADEYSDPEKGSGAVKITPAHDFNDFEVGKRHGLAMINVFDVSANMNDEVPQEFRGLDRFSARDKVVAALETQGLLEKIEENPMTVPYGDRSGVVIEPRLTDQWYVDAETMAKPAIEAIESGATRFVPKHWENTYFEWMRNIQPWCISRQIWWGHQIPAWYGPDNEVFVAETADAAAKLAEEHYGKSVELTQEDDVLDTWFSSALWPFSTLGWPEETPEVSRYYPTNVLVTGFDIIFFWVARMMMMGLHFMKEVPFDTVYIHALVRDEKGQKMSKSKGNVLDPLELIDEYGADTLRFTLTAMAAQGRDIRLSTGRIEGYRNFITKLWNAARYAEMNGCISDPDFDPTSCTQTVNQWIVGSLAETEQSVSRAFEEYRFNDAANAIYQFTWHSFCDWYLEFTKPILAGDDAAAMAETRATTGWILDQILLLLHPMAPFVTEELWGELAPEGGRDSNIITADWPKIPSAVVSSDASEEMDWVVRLISEIRTVRAEMNVPAGAKTDLLIKDYGAITSSRLEQHAELIQRMARIEKIELISEDTPKGAVQAIVDEATYFLPVGDVIDIALETERLEKEISKVEKEIAGLQKKLSNEKFTSRAPAEVVEENRERLADYERTRDKLAQALERLKSL
ncbi:MAG: valine--tRNA ligase [Rhodospirillaceae bacterium]|nr:valine--tRNA ligase [Rhodospirillaceae bacterium]